MECFAHGLNVHLMNSVGTRLHSNRGLGVFIQLEWTPFLYVQQ